MYRNTVRYLFPIATLLVVSFWFMPDAYWVDWDNLMYMAQVKIHMNGNHGFSFMHNLINSYIYRAFLIGKIIWSDISIYESTQGLTIFFGFIGSLSIYFAIRHLTCSWFSALIGGFLWFIFPGNIILYHTIEDNVWASAFVSLIICSAIKSYNITFTSPADRNNVSWLWVIAAAAMLSIGINIHQQVGLMFYVFIIMTTFTPAITFSDKYRAVVLFISVYLLGSILQNYIVFREFEIYNSIQRLYHNPYQSVFPKLYFFSSGLSLMEWSALIITGWKKTLLYDGVSVPMLIYFLTGLLFTFVTVSRPDRVILRNSFCIFKKLAWLSIAVFLLIPYSLLFEPQNIERWDSCIPGTIILAVTICHAAINHIHKRLAFHDVTHISRPVITSFFVLFLVLTVAQSVSFIQKERNNYNNSYSVKMLDEIIDFLHKRNDRSNLLLLLDQKLKHRDMQTLISLEFPDVSYIVLNNSHLKPVISSDELTGSKKYPDKPIYQIDLPEHSVLGIMPRIFNRIQSEEPEFIKKPSICAGTFFSCDLTQPYFLSQKRMFSYEGQDILDQVQFNRETKTRKSDDSIILDVTGNDPSLILPVIEAVQPPEHIILYFKITSENQTTAKLYYKTHPVHPYSEKMSIKTPVTKGNNDIFFLLPQAISMQDIRFDIGEQPGHYSIERIEGKSVSLIYE